MAWREGRTVNKPEKKGKAEKIQFVINLDPKNFETVERVHVGGPGALITHYLIKAGPIYVHLDNLAGHIHYMNEAQYQKYRDNHLRLEISREKIKVPNPRAAALRVKKDLENGSKWNLVQDNCYTWTNWIIYGSKKKP